MVRIVGKIWETFQCCSVLSLYNSWLAAARERERVKQSELVEAKIYVALKVNCTHWFYVFLLLFSRWEIYAIAFCTFSSFFCPSWVKCEVGPRSSYGNGNHSKKERSAVYKYCKKIKYNILWNLFTLFPKLHFGTNNDFQTTWEAINFPAKHLKCIIV